MAWVGPTEGIFFKDFVADGLGAGWATSSWVLNSFPKHRRANNFVACTCFYIAEDAESSEALEDMAVRLTFRAPMPAEVIF